LLLISFAVRIRWRSGTSLSPAHVLLPTSRLSLMYTFTTFDSFYSYGAFRRTKPHTHTNSSDSCLRCKGTLAKCRYVDDLKRYFQSSLALLLTRGFNPSRCESRCTRTKMLSFPITVFCISFLLNFSNTFTLSFKPASHPAFI